MSEDKRIVLVSNYLKRNYLIWASYVLHIYVLSSMIHPNFELGINIMLKLVN